MRSAKKQQKGAVLVISLLMLLVITLVGLSNLSNTALETRMVSNMQSKHHVFQAAEAGLVDAGENMDFMGEVCVASKKDQDPPHIDVSNPSASFSANRVKSDFVQSIIDKGSSVREGAQGLMQYHFKMESTAELSADNSQAVHKQGAYLWGPKADGACEPPPDGAVETGL